MSIQYTGLGFEPTTSRHELSPITIRPGLPPDFQIFYAPSPEFLFKFCSSQAIYRIKTVYFSRIQTWIVGVKGKHIDHLTITMALVLESTHCRGNFDLLGTYKYQHIFLFGQIKSGLTGD